MTPLEAIDTEIEFWRDALNDAQVPYWECVVIQDKIDALRVERVRILTEFARQDRPKSAFW